MDAKQDYVVYFLRGYMSGFSITKVGYTGDRRTRWTLIRMTEHYRGNLDAIDSAPVMMFVGLTKRQAINLEAQFHESLTEAGCRIYGEWFGLPDDCLDLLASRGEKETGYRVERPNIKQTYFLPVQRNYARNARTGTCID